MREQLYPNEPPVYSKAQLEDAVKAERQAFAQWLKDKQDGPEWYRYLITEYDIAALERGEFPV